LSVIGIVLYLNIYIALLRGVNRSEVLPVCKARW